VNAAITTQARDARYDVRRVDFRLVSALPADVASGWFAHYAHIPTDRAGWRLADVRGAIDAHATAWLDAFDAWHAALGQWAERRSRWWWLTRGSRPNVWGQRPVLKPLFFAAGLLEWAAETGPCEPVYIVGAPSEVASYLEELRMGVSVAGAGATRRRLRGVAVALLDAAHQLRTLVASYVLRRSPHARGGVVFYSHVVDAASLAAVGDHFFGAMLPAAERHGAGETLLAVLLHVDADRPAAEAAIRASGSRFCVVLDYLTLADVGWLVKQLLQCLRAFAREPKGMPVLRLGTWSSPSFLSRYFAMEVQRWLPVTELAVYRAMRRLLRSTGAGTLVYPYEEKGVERGILRAAAEAGVHRTAAFGHAAHTRAHLALRARPHALNPPAPELLLATGHQAARFLVEWGGKAPERVVVVGSPRFFSSFAPARSARERRAGVRALVIIGHGFELTMFANFVQARPDIALEHDVLVRSYRFNWRDEQEDAIRRLRILAPRIRVDDNQTLTEQIGWCDVAIFDSTTAGIQAMLSGRLAIHAALHDLFAVDPVQEIEALFARCGNADELANALTRATAFPDEAHARIVARQREVATSILAPLDGQRLAEALVATPRNARGHG